MQSKWVDLDVTGEKMPAYLAEPSGPALGGVIVIQEIFGVNDDMQRIADLLAAQGFLAIAPAMFHRTDPHFDATHDMAGIGKGLAAAGPLTFEQIEADLAAAAGHLRSLLGAGARVGTWGFCFGGSVAYLSASLPFVDAAVSFYGGQIAKSMSPARPATIVATNEIHAPLLLAFGGKDASIPASEIALVREALEKANASFDLRVYAEEDHAFFRKGPEGNDGSREVWPVVEAFLKKNVTA